MPHHTLRKYLTLRSRELNVHVTKFKKIEKLPKWRRGRRYSHIGVFVPRCAGDSSNVQLPGAVGTFSMGMCLIMFLPSLSRNQQIGFEQ